jgi:hypothetical protein
MTRLRLLVGTSFAAGALLCSGAATAKDFSPGDLRVCGAKRCVAIENRVALRAFSDFYWGGGRVAVVGRPRVGAPAFVIRFRDGSAAGMVASSKLDRARVYGLNCGRFRRGRWYQLPARAAMEVRRLSAPLTPIRLTRRAPPRSC